MERYQLLIYRYSRETKMILPELNDKRRSSLYVVRLLAATLVVMIFVFAGIAADAAVKQKGYASAEEAVKAFVAATKSNDDKELLSIFGPDEKKLISSGDPVSDKMRRERFISEY
ncbi:MAG TPA: hypothetical protein DCP92_06230, partial [Nitrospiraceae bacterium]|nr:hypothetical protein [Nitrospiraceae bacterium]